MSLFEIPLTTIEGCSTTLEPYRGRMLLIVNVASRCGFTPQYKGLETLYRRHTDDLVVFGFPCDQFGHQEPGSDAQILDFCRDDYNVTFPLFAKVEVNGPRSHELFRHLKAAKKGFLGRESIGWNFTKFLVGRDGLVLKRYPSRISPAAIERELFG